MITLSTKRKGIQTALVLLLLNLANTAHAWTVEDCRRDPIFLNLSELSVDDCVRRARILEQQNLPNGDQPSEAQRLARVKDILARQKVIKPGDSEDRQLCARRFNDFVAGKGFEVIEPVFVLDSRWQDNWEPGFPANKGGDPRVPKLWNQCVRPYLGSNKKRLDRSFGTPQMNSSFVVPPYRLYELNQQQRPSTEWKYLIDFSKNSFDAVSLDKCEFLRPLLVTDYTGLKDVHPPAQAYALTRYKQELIAVSIVDGLRFGFYSSDRTGRHHCNWRLFDAD